MFSTCHLLLEKYSSHGFLIPLFLFPAGKYKVKCFPESRNREARWPFEQREHLMATCLSASCRKRLQCAILDTQWSRDKNRALTPE